MTGLTSLKEQKVFEKSVFDKIKRGGGECLEVLRHEMRMGESAACYGYCLVDVDTMVTGERMSWVDVLGLESTNTEIQARSTLSLLISS